MKFQEKTGQMQEYWGLIWNRKYFEHFLSIIIWVRLVHLINNKESIMDGYRYAPTLLLTSSF